MQTFQNCNTCTYIVKSLTACLILPWNQCSDPNMYYPHMQIEKMIKHRGMLRDMITTITNLMLDWIVVQTHELQIMDSTFHVLEMLVLTAEPSVTPS